MSDTEKRDTMNTEGLVALKPDDFETMLERAAHKGAKRALESVGLGDDNASDDIRDARALVSDWRTVKSGFLRALGRVLLWGVVLIIAAFGIKTGLFSDMAGKP